VVDNKYQWQAVENRARNLGVPQDARDLDINRATVGFSRSTGRNLLCGVRKNTAPPYTIT
jgi:hypothetical protein